MNVHSSNNHSLSSDYAALCRTRFNLVETSLAPVTIATSENAAVLTLSGYDCDVWLGSPGRVAHVIFDFGEQIVGSVKFKVCCSQSARVELFYGEDLAEALRNEDYTGGWYHLPHDVFELQSGQHEIQNSGRRAFRYVRVQVQPQLEVQPQAEMKSQTSQVSCIHIQYAEAVLCHYPVVPHGRFSCSDSLLNRAWEISERTTRLCMQQYYEDGVKRDGLLWIGDYRLQFLCNAMLYGDVALARKCLGMMALSQFDDGRLPACAVRGGAHQHPSNINYMFHLPGEPDNFMQTWVIINYVTDFVSCVREYFDYTGDVETVRELWPATQRVLTWLSQVDIWQAKRGHDYITDVQPDFPDAWWGARGALPAHLHWAARDGALLAEHLGDKETSSLCDSLLECSRHLSLQFQDAENGLYRDDMNEGVSWQTHSLAVLSGLVSSEDSVRVLQTVSERMDARYCIISFMELYRLWAEFEVGRAVEALTEMRRYWGHMLRYDATSCWDACNINLNGIERPDTHAMSHCHGWGAGPAFLLPTFILGLKPIAPGWKQVLINPQLGDLDWAEGTVPTPYGVIEIKWKRVAEPSGNSLLQGTVQLPEGISARLDMGSTEYLLTSGRHEFIV